MLFYSCQSSFKCDVNSIKYKLFDEKHIITNKTNKKVLNEYISNGYCKNMANKSKEKQMDVCIEPLLVNSKDEGVYYIETYVKNGYVPLYKNRKIRYTLLVNIDNNVNILSEDDEVSNNKIYDLLLEKFTPEQLEKYKEDIKAGCIYMRQ